MTNYESGDPVEVRTAFDVWQPAVARSGVEGTHAMRDGRWRKIHDFPVVWVALPGYDGQMPWPAEDVRPHPQPNDERGSQ